MSSGTTRYNVKMAKKKGDEKLNQTPQSDNEDQNFDEEPNFEDPEGFVDDIPDEGRSSEGLRLARPYASPTHLPAFFCVCANNILFYEISELQSVYGSAF